MYTFNNFDIEIKEAMERFLTEMKSIQTGRATPMVLDNVYIDAYGSKMQLSHVASVNLEDAKTLLVVPYDKGVMKDLEQGINDANLGLSVAAGSEGLRVIFPMLTTERRTQYVKIVKEKLEDVRIKIRGVREDAKKEIESKAKDGAYGEDDKKRFLDLLQSKVDAANDNAELAFKNKESDIMGDN
jgi:ribosome recycling factor